MAPQTRPGPGGASYAMGWGLHCVTSLLTAHSVGTTWQRCTGYMARGPVEGNRHSPESVEDEAERPEANCCVGGWEALSDGDARCSQSAMTVFNFSWFTRDCVTGAQSRDDRP